MLGHIDFEVGCVEDEPELYLDTLSLLLTDVRGALCGAADHKLYFIEPDTRIRLTRCRARTADTPWFEIWGIKPGDDMTVKPGNSRLGISARADITSRHFQLIKHFHCCEECSRGTAQIFLCLPAALASAFKAAFTAEAGEFRYILTQIFLQQTAMQLIERSAPSSKNLPEPAAKDSEPGRHLSGPGVQ